MKIEQYGMEGYEVKLLQYALSRAGLEPGNLDGIFGRRTLRALQQFQREQGIASDGAAGKLSWAALYPYITGYTLHRMGPEEQIEPLDMAVVTDQIPCSYLLTSLMLKGLVMRWPFLRVYEIGRSVMGRPIRAVAIGEGAEPVGYVGPHRAAQWPYVTIMLRFMEEFATRYASEERWARDLLTHVTLHMVPLVNPDGMDLVTGALDPLDSFYAQAQALAAYYPGIPFPQGWESNISGVDLSLQYPFQWSVVRRARFQEGFIRPGPRGYVGSEPLIAPECRAIVRWMEAQDFSRVLSYDEGYVSYCRSAWGCPGHVLQGDMEEVRSILSHDQPFSP